MSNEDKNKCKCPFCDGELDEAFIPFCKTCNVMIKYCIHCGKPIPVESTICPECGQS
jgi:hypothetical protein